MNQLTKFFESVFYGFGFNFSGYNVTQELELLGQHLPSTFCHRRLTDIGCGDGTITHRLIPILKPKSTLGLDLYPSLVHRAISRGLDARVVDVENQPPGGDLGVLWGVVHHFLSPQKTLATLSHNFKSLLIRESIDTSRFFESGHRFSQKELTSLIKSVSSKAQFIYTPQKSVLIFIG